MKKYFIQTFGCQMNIAESDNIKKTIHQHGYAEIENYSEADLVVINTCTVRQAPENKVIELLRNLNKLKKKKTVKVMLTGCITNLILGSNRSKPNKTLLKKLSGVDLFFPSNDLDCLRSFLVTLSDKEKNELPINQYSDSAYIPISKGCDNFCSYCVVPFTRGPEQSRQNKEIIDEVKEKVKQGIIEITLLGQNVNSYELEGNKRLEFEKSREKNPSLKVPLVQLLEKLNSIKGLERIFFLTSHPKDMSLDLIKAVKKLPKLCNYIHLPLQSGSDRVLKKMNRNYTKKQYLKLIETIRKNIPNVAISTDIIVGFPGETEEDFQDTVEVMEKVGFDMAFISRYSPRPYAASSKTPDSIPENIKKKRRLILNNIVEETSLNNNKKLLDTEQEVLITSKKNKNTYIGRLYSNKEVHFFSKENYKIGEIVLVKIIKAFPWGLEGKIK